MKGEFRSYYVILEANKGTLLGGVVSHRSSRFRTVGAATAWRDQALSANREAGRDVRAAIHPTRALPEIDE